MKLPDILDNIKTRLNITELTPVQQQMAALTATRSIKLVAPTGSGKTLAFAVNILKVMGHPGEKTATVILAPSRELARQVNDVVRNASGGTYRVTVCYGGHPFIEEERSLSGGADIIVATPGRLLDHIRRRTVDLSKVSNLVIDEFDKSLELGFSDEMKRIVKSLPALKHIVVTSATNLVEWPDYMPDNFEATIDTTGDSGKDEPRNHTDISMVKSFTRDKLDTLCDLLLTLKRGRTIVFVNHRESAERVFARLKHDGFAATMLHGAMPQPERENALEMMANGSAPVMVATDLASRGLDVDEVENVVHYHIPPTAESWTHRNGRTSRMGASGNVYVITHEEESLPPYIEWDRDYIPNPQGLTPEKAGYATLYLNLGKKEKISRGDIVGFLTANSDIQGSGIGRISLRDHCALVAVEADKADTVLRQLQGKRIKNKRVRISELKA